MPLKLYNTLTRKKEIFRPIKDKQVGIYGCGPTVYWYQHIGNLRRYIFEDLLIRTLLFNGYNVKHLINVTDVGHLTSDADEGEDKVEKAAKKEGKTAKQVTHYYFNEFKKDLEKLNFIMPNKWLWATEHIKEQIELVKVLEKKGFTYQTKDGIYFNTSKLKDYGKLANLNFKGLQKGKRVKFGEKKNKTDFALWKFSVKPDVRQQEWNSPWGVGFPGWHIECSTMSSKYLGKHFDIHTGGIDHIQIHHTNEIAQSESAFGKKPWVNYWMHSGHLRLKKGKMSKSAGSILRLEDLEKKGYSPMNFRYLVLSVHYRKPLIFSFENLKSAKNSWQSLKNIILEIKDDKKINKNYLKEFEEAINDDLNTPKALQVLWKLVRDKKAKGKYLTIKKMDEVLRLDLLKPTKGRYIFNLNLQDKTSISDKIKEEIKISDEVEKLLKERKIAREKKDWKKADELRDKIRKLGYQINDTEKGVEIKRK